MLRLFNRTVWKYFSIPLEQGLRRERSHELLRTELYFSIPLEQGLRRKLEDFRFPTQSRILVFH